ncbi:MAG: homoserine dehydrogenase [Pseudomonadota bacterium]
MTKSTISVGLIGAGAMGRGIAIQVKNTPGLELRWVADIADESAREVGRLSGAPSSTDALHSLSNSPVDVVVEATNSIAAAATYSFASLESGAHVVLMNAEVDLALAPLLQYEAKSRNLIVTSDAGDQHGVLAKMIEEADLLGFSVVQAGNIKGFLDRYATPESIAAEAAKRRLSATQCCAYTDGTKLHIEMAVLANAFGYNVPAGGMQGPQAEHVTQALDLFDFDAYGGTPRIDYILGAEPGGGVYLVVKLKEGFPEDQRFFLDYYKLGDGPYYLMYRPYHLCHLETPKAIFEAASGRSWLAPGQSNALLSPSSCGEKPGTDVYAFAKRPLRAGERVAHAIGSEHCYGLVSERRTNQVPITLLESPATLVRDLEKDEPIQWSDIECGPCSLLDHWRRQESLIRHVLDW